MKSKSTSIFKLFQIKGALPALIIGICLSACSEEEPSLTESFFKIYDDSNFDVSYKPIDVVEVEDGYIILTGTQLDNTDFNGVRLLKIDEEGEFEFDVEFDEYVVPIGDMYLNGADSNAYFFAMNPVSREAILLGVNPRLDVEVEATISGVNYPLASAVTSGGNLLLLGYDNLSQETEIAEVGLNGGFERAPVRFSIGPGDDVVEEIINHYLNASERPLSFFCGEVSPGNYYFNGFYNYSLSLVFTDFSDSPTQVLEGQDTDAATQALLPLGSGNFALAGYQFNENFQLASTPINVGNIGLIFPGNMAEIKPYTPTKIKSYNNGSQYSVFASETKSQQILLNFYDESGAIAGTYRVGFLNPFTLASIKALDDNSLLVLGTTFTAGRFERVVLNRISASEINDIIN